MKVRVSFLIGALLLWSLPVAAQVTTGRILGVIQDDSQAASCPPSRCCRG